MADQEQETLLFEINQFSMVVDTLHARLKNVTVNERSTDEKK